MFRGFEAAKTFDPAKGIGSADRQQRDFSSVKGPARWREDHAAEYKYAAFLVKGKGCQGAEERVGPVHRARLVRGRSRDAVTEVARILNILIRCIAARGFATRFSCWHTT